MEQERSDAMLSILIPTLTDRERMLSRLMDKLNSIIRNYPVEILIEEDQGQLTTGAKRNKLVDRANGLFSAFIDDDDDVPEWYFDSIFRLLHNEPDCDCIGFKGLIMWSDPQRRQRTETFKHAHGLPYSNGKIHGEYRP